MNLRECKAKPIGNDDLIWARCFQKKHVLVEVPVYIFPVRERALQSFLKRVYLSLLFAHYKSRPVALLFQELFQDIRLLALIRLVRRGL